MKKAQAGTEFIMTYGWAIMAALLAISALAYFGILSPDKYIPETCTLQPGLTCLDWRVYYSGNNYLGVVIKNNLGYDIQNITVHFGGCGADIPGGLLRGGDEVNAYRPALTNGQSGLYYSQECNLGLKAGTKYSDTLNVTYLKIETQINHTNHGFLQTRVEG